MTTIISGSNRHNSYTLKLATYYQRKLAEKGYDAKLLSLTELPDCLINADRYDKEREHFKPIQDLISATDKFLFIIPEYNGSFPGVLKILIDSCKYPESFYGKKAALVGLSSGRYGNIRGVDHFTGVCHYLNMNVMPLKIHIPAIGKELDENGELFKEDTVRFTNQQMEQFIGY